MREEVENAVHQACAQLRFAEGLRRRWAQARAEASVQEAHALATALGVRVEVGALRRVTLERSCAELPPDLDYARSIWQATWRIASLLSDLNATNPTPPVKATPIQILAGLHKDACAALVRAGKMSLNEVANPQNAGQFLAEQQDLEAQLRRGEITGLDVVAQTWAQLAVGSLFAREAEVVAVNYAKWQLASLGIEPTGVSVLAQWRCEQPQVYQLTLAAWQAGKRKPWHDFVGDSLVRACEVGLRVARQVQAGTLGEELAG